MGLLGTACYTWGMLKTSSDAAGTPFTKTHSQGCLLARVGKLWGLRPRGESLGGHHTAAKPQLCSLVPRGSHRREVFWTPSLAPREIKFPTAFPSAQIRGEGTSVLLKNCGKFITECHENLSRCSPGPCSWLVASSKANVILFIIHDKPAGNLSRISKPDVTLSIVYNEFAVGG